MTAPGTPRRGLLVPMPEAFAFMADVAARGGPSALKRRTPTPERRAVTFPLDGEVGTADLYVPGTPPRAALLLVPGVARGGKDDPRLVGFATSIARLGFTVLVPELATLRELNVRPGHKRIVAAAFEHLLAQPAWAPDGRAGIGGLSFAMGPGVIAALEPALRERVRFLFCIGGYFDLLAVIRYVVTGRFRERGPAGEGPWQHLPPDPYGRWVFTASMLDNVPDPASRAALRAMVDRRTEDPRAPIDDLVPAVTEPAARALLDLVLSDDADGFDARYAALSAAMREDVAAMDVARRDLTALSARLILVHGIDDDIIPYAESLALHHRARAGRSRVFIVRGLSHVTVGRPGLRDAWRMLASVQALLNERGPRRR